jgi:hypothetical protein
MAVQSQSYLKEKEKEHGARGTGLPGFLKCAELPNASYTECSTTEHAGLLPRWGQTNLKTCYGAAMSAEDNGRALPASVFFCVLSGRGLRR